MGGFSKSTLQTQTLWDGAHTDQVCMAPPCPTHPAMSFVVSPVAVWETNADSFFKDKPEDGGEGGEAAADGAASP